MDPNEAKPVLGARSKSGLEMLYLYSGLDICIPMYKDIYIYKVSLYIYIYTYIYIYIWVLVLRVRGVQVWGCGEQAFGCRQCRRRKNGNSSTQHGKV